MILLPYELKYNNSSQMHYCIEKISHFSLRETLMDILLHKFFHSMVFEFRSGGHLCLTCRFTDETDLKDDHILNLNTDWYKKKKQNEFYNDIIDRIASELIQYEQGKFTHREIEI